MNRPVTLLLLLFIAQCVLLGVLHYGKDAIDEQSADAPLISTVPADVSRLTVRDSANNEVQLNRQGKIWALPQLSNLPADASRVERVLQGLESADNSWPVARSSAARQRFQVARYYFQRRLTLATSEGQQETVFLGTSPGFRKVYARNEQHNPIYSIELNVYDAPMEPADWLASGLLQLRSPIKIWSDSYSLDYDGGNWRSGTGGTPEPDELATLLMALRTLQIEGIASHEDSSALAQQQPLHTLDVTGLAAQQTLGFYRHEARHFVHSSRFPYYFNISAYDYERLTGIDFVRISGTTSSTSSAGN